VKLPAGMEINLPIPEGDTCGVYLVEGEAISGENTMLPTTMTRYTEEGESITVKAAADSHFMVLGGQPLNEPIVAYASFVMNSQQQIQQVIQDYQSGKMGQL
jgi:redox-sensitive bicupin YhaK (pirin superfamily)